MDQADPKNQQNIAKSTNIQQHSVNPVGSAHKESAPIAQNIEAPTADFIKPAEVEPQLHPEVKEAGVEATAEKLNLPEDVKQAGVELAKESVPVQTQPTGSVSLPMNQQQATQALQTNKKKTSKSIVWFATIILRLLKKQNAHQVKGEDIIGG